MSTPEADRIQKQTIEFVTQGQKAALEVVGAITESWTDVTRRVSNGAVGGLPTVGLTGPGGLPAASAEAVDRFFDTGVQVLEAQRALVHGMLSAFSPAR